MKNLFTKLLMIFAFVTIVNSAKAQDNVSDIPQTYKYYYYTGTHSSFNSIVAYFYPGSTCSMCTYTDSTSASVLDGGAIYPNYHVLLKKDGSVVQWSLADSSVFNGLYTHDTSKWYIDKPNYLKVGGIPTAISSGARNFNQAYRISTTKRSTIAVSPQIACALSLTGGQSGKVVLEISPNGSTGWIYAGQLTASNTGTLTIGLNTTQISGGMLLQDLPIGYYWRLTTTNVTSTPTFTFNGGNEITY